MSHLNIIQAAFSAQAENFSQPGLTVTDPNHVGWMMASLELSPGWLVLDVAAGTGLLSRAMAPQVRQAVALDATPAMIREGAKAGLPNVFFVNSIAEYLPSAANTFDMVICRFAIHHFVDPMIPVREMVRVVRTGGRVALIDLVAPDDERLAQSYNHLEQLRDPSHTRALRQIELEALIGDRGLALSPSLIRDIPVHVDRWLALTKTDEKTSEVIRGELRAELRGATTTGMRPFVADDALYFQQTWVITIGRKLA